MAGVTEDDEERAELYLEQLESRAQYAAALNAAFMAPNFTFEDLYERMRGIVD